MIIQIMFIVFLQPKILTIKTMMSWNLPYSTKLWWDKTLADLELQENWWIKFWWFVMLITVHYKNLQHLADKTLADC